MPFGEDLAELVQRELAQARETGHAVDALERRFVDTAPDDAGALESLYEEILGTPRSPGWNYDEPDDIDAFLTSTPPDDAPPALSDGQIADKVFGGWLGRIAGCNLGKPVEDGDHWTTDRLRSYLELAGAWPLRDYIPALEPMPAGFRFRDCWTETTRGRVHGSARDDDIDYSIIGLHLLEERGAALTSEDVAQAWLSQLPYNRVFTAERIAYRNVLAGVPVDRVALHRNPCREWIGALIRGDAFGWTHPGLPRRAASLASRDAALSHAANGVYGEIWSAALVSSAFTATSAREACDRALCYVPPRSRLGEALNAVSEIRDGGATWESAIETIQQRWGAYSWVHTVNNAAVIAAGLLWGDDDFATAVGLTVAGGWDTDSNGATAGSVMGVLCGAGALPGHFVDPLENRVRSAVFGADNSPITALAARTVALARAPL